MIIGQFCETYPPALDGVGRVMLAYCQTLSAMGHRCLYVAPRDSANTSTPGCETLLYSGVGIPGEPYRIGVPAFSRAYRRAVKATPFDLVHAHTPFLAGRAARRIARKRGVPLVATFHSKYYDDFYRATHSRALAKLALKYVVSFYNTCDEVWAVNERTADVLRGYGYRGHIVCMPNGTDRQTVDEETYNRVLARYPLRDNVPTLIFVGQMDVKKNTPSMLRACALLRDRGMDFQLLMVGAGQDLASLKALCASLHLQDRVLFTGFIGQREATLSLYRRADLLVFPSVYDNAPMVVREAAAMGTPALLVRDTCSAEEVTHGENGFLCENTVESIADGILGALPTAAQVGARARDTIPIPWDRLMQRVLARYQRLIDRHGERRPA